MARLWPCPRPQLRPEDTAAKASKVFGEHHVAQYGHFRNEWGPEQRWQHFRKSYLFWHLTDDRLLFLLEPIRNPL